MTRYLITRFFAALVVVFGVMCIVFFMIHLVPGDPVEMMLGESAQAADREALRASLGLDQPITVQFLQYVQRLLVLDLGQSLHYRQPIAEILAERIPSTVQLALAAMTVAICLAFPLGILGAIRRGTIWESLASGFSLAGISIPNFWLGPILILVFSLWLGWFPVSGKQGIESFVLPAMTMGTALAAILARMIRSTLLEVLNEDYIRTARAKGLNESTIILGHALRNALLPVITLIGLQLGTLLGGAVITETVFSWPGVGQLTIEAIQKRDYPVVQACVILISTSYVVVNVFTDLIYAWVDPRIRLGEGH